MPAKVYWSFWLFGLLNNVLYVAILSAAIDLVGPLVPKATVLLADILPAFIIKINSPFFIHLVPYSYRIISLIVLSMTGMLLVVFGSLKFTILGIVLASLSSGLGEITFLQLTHFYEDTGLNGWSSGTGAAGLIGSGAFMISTTVLGASAKVTLLLFSVFPLGFLYYFRLPEVNKYQALHETEDESVEILTPVSALEHISLTLTKLQKLIVPYMLPLSTVYFAEYTINQSVAPTLLFPLDELPFHNFRDVYVTYGTLYQLGVLISRSSGSIIRVRKLYILSLLQFGNLLLLILQSLYFFMPNVYIIMIFVFYEGLLGGASYVNTFMSIIEHISVEQREFALGATSMSDSGGIVISALFGLWLETNLCKYQVAHGREWCQKQ